MDGILFVLALAAFGFFAWRRLPRYLHILQQDDYNGRRFLKWLWETRTFDRRVSLALLVAAGLGWVFSFATDDLLFAIVFAVFAVLEPDPRKAAKKKFVMTQRAQRIFGAALALNLISAGICFAIGSLAAIITVQIIPLLLVLANVMLKPVETRIQEKIMYEASVRLAQVNPHIVGITGSFGKTSVKHILGHILEMNAPTLYTPGSVNTLMGISRIIRERMQSDCRYFLVEMGAYGEGSIRKLCGLTPPRTGIITAIGEAHVERFKTLDTVARAKFELAEAVLKQNEGQVVIHENVLDQNYAAQFVQANPKRFVICGRQGTAEFKIEGLEQTAAGLTVLLRWKDQIYTLTAPLFGAHHADNMGLAFAAAVTLGIVPERAVIALKTVPQIKHRLEVKHPPNGGIIIDDAFNSNPTGFAGALELMTMLADGKRRRILMTPGLVELGEKHDAVHHLLGVAAAKHADIALAVRGDRIRAFIDGFKSAKPDGAIHSVASLAEAQKWLAANGAANDVLLIENDLPDVHERRLAI